MRLYDVTDGNIYYGGNDIRKYTTKEYRDYIGAVYQDYQIYGATLAENVMMGDENRVIEALKLADFDAWKERARERTERKQQIE